MGRASATSCSTAPMPGEISGEGSDVDILVLLDGPVDTGREILRIEPIAWPLSSDHGIVLSVMPLLRDIVATVRRETRRSSCRRSGSERAEFLSTTPCVEEQID